MEQLECIYIYIMSNLHNIYYANVYIIIYIIIMYIISVTVLGSFELIPLSIFNLLSIIHVTPNVQRFWGDWVVTVTTNDECINIKHTLCHYNILYRWYIVGKLWWKNIRQYRCVYLLDIRSIYNKMYLLNKNIYLDRTRSKKKNEKKLLPIRTKNSYFVYIQYIYNTYLYSCCR